MASCSREEQGHRKKRRGPRLRRPTLDSLAIAVGNLDAVLEVPIHIHEAPLVFPLLALLVERLLPGLVKG